MGKKVSAKNKWKILDIDTYLQPFAEDIDRRMNRYEAMYRRLLPNGGTLSDFANAHLYFGLHATEDGWVYREWAPAAQYLSLVGDFNDWNGYSNPMTRGENGVWEVFVAGRDTLPHGSRIKVRVTANGQTFDRIPLYVRRVQQESGGAYNGVVWHPETEYVFRHPRPVQKKKQPLLIYECHVGMATEEYGIGSYREFTEKRLPYIKEAGYTAIQLMAVMEHGYYASFGYQVTNFFAASSRFGTPEELKELIDTAHGLGLTVLLDVIHSHASTNTMEGINLFDGTEYQFFHAGARGDHSAWGTKVFDYGKGEVVHFLLSNLKFWLDEYHFDGFRFDGITSMLYQDHGLGESFDNYHKYFSLNTDEDAITYLQLANTMIREVYPDAVTIAEDMSGMPGMCLPLKDGGIGFDFRLAMGMPDYWVRTVSKTRDEDWNMGKMWYELTTRRPKEKNIGYCESHDQALVGDKTIMFWLADQDMYWHMSHEAQNDRIRRAVALHKMIRLISFLFAGEGYLNFMGNEFGHPEWIDFPREGNGDSYHYARRQWSLVQNPKLLYHNLGKFDQAMLDLAKKHRLYSEQSGLHEIHEDDKRIVCHRGNIWLLCNFHTFATQTVDLPYEEGMTWRLLLNTGASEFGGAWNDAAKKPTPYQDEYGNWRVSVTLPARTALVYERRKSKQ